jgi:hypothetical protein
LLTFTKFEIIVTKQSGNLIEEWIHLFVQQSGQIVEESKEFGKEIE